MLDLETDIVRMFLAPNNNDNLWTQLFALGDACEYCGAIREEYLRSGEICKFDLQDYARHLYEVHLRSNVSFRETQFNQ